MFANGGGSGAELAVAKNCTRIPQKEARFFKVIAALFRKFPDEEGTEIRNCHRCRAPPRFKRLMGSKFEFRGRARVASARSCAAPF